MVIAHVLLNCMYLLTGYYPTTNCYAGGTTMMSSVN